MIQRKRRDFYITEALEGKTVNEILRKVLGYSANRVRSLKFEPEGIELNSVRVKTDHRVHEGDLLSILAEDSSNRERKILANPMTLDILYEDDAYIAVNKSSGTVCHPSSGHLTDTLANGLRAYLDQNDPGAGIHFIGRLDKDTSGIVLIAKSCEAQTAMQEEEKRGGYEKEYLALSEGYFTDEEGEILSGMRVVRDAVTGISRLVPDPVSGKKTETHWSVLGRSGEETVLKVLIRTGRMHQIRAHMALIGHPLAGDILYGGSAGKYPHTMLHARKLTWVQPFTGEVQKTEAALPAEWEEIFDTIKLCREA